MSGELPCGVGVLSTLGLRGVRDPPHFWASSLRGYHHRHHTKAGGGSFRVTTRRGAHTKPQRDRVPPTHSQTPPPPPLSIRGLPRNRGGHFRVIAALRALSECVRRLYDPRWGPPSESSVSTSQTAVAADDPSGGEVVGPRQPLRPSGSLSSSLTLPEADSVADGTKPMRQHKPDSELEAPTASSSACASLRGFQHAPLPTRHTALSGGAEGALIDTSGAIAAAVNYDCG